MARNYSSVVEPKALTANITDATATQITLNNVTGLPSAPYVLVINPDTAKEEVVLVTVDQTGVTSPTLKVQRAIEASGGVGVARDNHTIGDVVKHMIVGSDLQIVHDHVDNTSAHDATGGVVGLTKSQTLTNKTINLTSNTLTGTLAQFNTSLSDADFATTTTTQTLTSKTLTSPTITGPSISNATFTGTSTFPESGAGLVPVGVVAPFAGATAPTGWLLCFGQTLNSITDTKYAALWTAIGTTYGGSSSSSFNVPDLRGRVVAGVDNMGGTDAGRLDLANTRGTSSGAQNVTLTEAQMPVHSHGNTVTFSGDGAHTHTISTNIDRSAADSGNTVTLIDIATTPLPYLVTNSGEGGHSHSVSVSIANAGGTGGATQAHSVLQPTMVLNYIIKY